MLQIKKILCPTDFGEHSYKALEMAKDMALKYSAELTVMHVVSEVLPSSPEPFVSLTPEDIERFDLEVKASAEKKIDKIVEQVKQEGLEVNPVLARGTVAGEIVNFAEKNETDLLVIATHGRTGVSRFVFGSVAEKVIRISPCPVLVINSAENR